MNIFICMMILSMKKQTQEFVINVLILSYIVIVELYREHVVSVIVRVYVIMQLVQLDIFQIVLILQVINVYHYHHCLTEPTATMTLNASQDTAIRIRHNALIGRNRRPDNQRQHQLQHHRHPLHYWEHPLYLRLTMDAGLVRTKMATDQRHHQYYPNRSLYHMQQQQQQQQQQQYQQQQQQQHHQQHQ